LILCLSISIDTSYYDYLLPSFFFFFFNDTATTDIYTLSLHDALPISLRVEAPGHRIRASELREEFRRHRFPRLNVVREPAERRRISDPLLEHLGGGLNEVPLDPVVRVLDPAAVTSEHRVEQVPELVEQGL